MGFLQRGFRAVELVARDREVGRAPKRARDSPPVARAPEDVTRLCEVLLGGLVLARGRLDQTEPGERQSAPAAVAQPRAQLERPLQLPVRRRYVSFDEGDIRASHEHGREAYVVFRCLEARTAFVEQRVCPQKVAEPTRDSGLVRQRVADGRLAR